MADPVVSSYPGYATPVITLRNGRWVVGADPWKVFVGWMDEHPAGWTAYAPRYVDGVMTSSGSYVGLFPDKQAAGEALVKHAGYEAL